MNDLKKKGIGAWLAQHTRWRRFSVTLVIAWTNPGIQTEKPPQNLQLTDRWCPRGIRSWPLRRWTQASVLSLATETRRWQEAVPRWCRLMRSKWRSPSFLPTKTGTTTSPKGPDLSGDRTSTTPSPQRAPELEAIKSDIKTMGHRIHDTEQDVEEKRTLIGKF